MQTIYDILVRLEPNEYADKLCRALADYYCNYPTVTCFNFDAFVQLKEKDILKNRGLYEKTHKNMLEVEELIRGQLLSQDIEVVKDGLAGVLYWGFAYCPKLQQDNVSRFRDNVNDNHITRFKKLVNSDKDVGLWKIYNLHLPRFGQVSFTSKLLMFIDPNRYPILDSRIADFSQKSRFPLLRDITFNGGSIPLTDDGIRPHKNVEIYEKWACLCRDIAKEINKNSSSSCGEFRPVDVERAIYWRIPESRRNSDAFQLLAGPKEGLDGMK